MRMKSIKLGMVAAVGAAVSLASACAEDVVTPEQHAKYQKKLFALIDSDDDGKVTEKEFAIIVLWDEFRRYDADGDSKVSKAEFMQSAVDKSLYGELDRDGKGHITFEDCLGSKTIVKSLHDEWLSLLKQTGNKPAQKFLTLADLPEITP